MQSLIHLYNAALAELGGEQIPLNISPIENNADGAICQNVFPDVLNLALEAYEWGFAKKRAILALVPGQEAENPEYARRYAMPSDALRPIEIVAPRKGGHLRHAGCRSPSYVIEGNDILCNVEQAELLYVSRVTEPKRWPAYFSEVLKYGMAAVLASARNNDKQQKQWCEQKYEYALARACARDRAIHNARGPFSAWAAARGNRNLYSPRGWRG